MEKPASVGGKGGEYSGADSAARRRSVQRRQVSGRLSYAMFHVKACLAAEHPLRMCHVKQSATDNRSARLRMPGRSRNAVCESSDSRG